jgi:putative ABC transport system permease protein
MRALLQDMRHSIRSLRKARWFAMVAVAILALGIAASTVVFSVLDAVVLHSLPYPDADRLVVLHWQNQRGSRGDISGQAFFLLKNRARSFQSISAIYPLDVGVNLSGGGQPHYTRALRVSRDFFQVLGAAPLAGRTFLADEDRPGGPRCAILNYGFWMRDFNGDRSAIGRPLKLNGENYTIIGVMPQSFSSYPEAQVWVPLQLSDAASAQGNDYRVLGRLRKDVPQQKAQEEMAALSEEYRSEYAPEMDAGARVFMLQPFQDFLVRNVRQNLVLLFAAVSFLLLIACTNLSLLLLVRASARSHEIAVRAALGASRLHLMRTVLAESLVLAVAGGLVGLIAAKELLPFVPSLLPLALPLTTTIGINKDVLWFALGASLVTAAVVGFGPAFRISRVDLNEVLRQAGRGTGTSREQIRTEHTLIRIQTTLTLILLAGATLLFRGFMALQAVPPGFEARGVFVAQMSLAERRYATTGETAQFLDHVSDELRNVAQVESVAAVNGLPLEKGLNLPIFPTEAPNKIEHACEYRPITADYFHVLQVPLLAGRPFSDADHHGTTPVAIVNETLARQWWPHGTAIGHTVAVGQEFGNPFSDMPRLVVGVAADVHAAGLGRAAPPTVFVPIHQTPDNTMAFVNKLFLTSILIRTREPSGISERVRSAMAAADPDLPLVTARPLAEVVAASIAWPRFYVSLTTAFGLVALLLTTIGLYGLLRYRAVRRTREIAVRMALGASRFGVVALVVKEAARLVSAGLVLGIAGSILLKRLLAARMHDLDGPIVNSVFSAAMLMLTVATLTSILTAFRASSVQPMAVLRNE